MPVFFLFLGKICGGNVKKFVPNIIAELENESQKQYVILNALKEVRLPN
jgi:hypothetical protein